MKRFVSLLLTAVFVFCLYTGIGSASTIDEDFAAYLNVTKDHSQYNRSSYDYTTYLTMCDEKLTFIIVVDASTRRIDQIFFIGEGNTIDLTFSIDEKTSYKLTLANIDGEYSYHTLYKDEAALVKALGSAHSIKITYSTNRVSKEYELSSTETAELNALFNFLDEHDFASSVSSSYIDICEANSLLFPMTIE